MEEVRRILQAKLEDYLEEDGKRTFYLNDSKTWYLMHEQAEFYLKLHEDQRYACGMLAKEMNLIKQNLQEIVGEGFSRKTIYLDLGPGKAEKSKLLIEEALRQNKSVSYLAIDVNKMFLDIALAEISSLGVPAIGLEGDFEEQIARLCTSAPKFVYLGATMGNFKPHSILQTLHKSLSKEDRVYLSIEPQTSSIESLVDHYRTQEHDDMFTPVLEAVGFDGDYLEAGVRFNPKTSNIESFLTVRKKSTLKEFEKIKPGDKIVVGISFKPTHNQFRNLVSHYFLGDFYENEGKNFISFVGERK
ncbi:L-histidine N(alpha)-methyltransferase [Candidatus Woesearchaeota archaeon]|nr:L-histidine N(alpha)-methyltransferase [Candidatus Woesearchaeota archaeon]